LVIEEVQDVLEECVGVKVPVLDRPHFLGVEDMSTLKISV
jgi:hypothetical protein